MYEKEKNNVYVHHEIMLNSFPLCLEWINYDPSEADKQGSFLAVGTFMPQIEIWNLDIMDTVQPAFILGGSFDDIYEHGKTKVKGAHEDAVMSLSLCKKRRNVLASGSAD